MPVLNPDSGKTLRIVSLVPSQTELLYDLGLDAEVVGITKFCIHPEHWFRHKKRIGGTKNVNLEAVAALHPTLILANKEENDREQIEYLQAHYPVYVSDIVSIEDALGMISTIGELTQKSEQAATIIRDISAQRRRYTIPPSSLQVLYLIWYDPWMAAGRETFIDSMLQEAGLTNRLDLARYPVLSDDAIRDLQPDLIFLSSEPYPFKEKHVVLLQELCPKARILMVDGELFSWYGSRMSRSFAYFSALHESYR